MSAESSNAIEATLYRCHILTLFPEFFASPLQTSIMGRAIAAERLAVNLVDIREHATDKHRTTDDTPYGGGAGMVMKVEPIVGAIEFVEQTFGRTHRVLLSPQGRPFRQEDAQRLAKEPNLLMVCGRYEGVDERVREHYIDEQISLGDFVLTGGEFGALVVLDALARLLPGVLGNEESSKNESFSDARVLEHPHYTRPYDFRGHVVPEILRSGDHQRIEMWRRQRSLLRTKLNRPELFEEIRDEISEADLVAVEEQSLLESSPQKHSSGAPKSGPSAKKR